MAMLPSVAANFVGRPACASSAAGGGYGGRGEDGGGGNKGVAALAAPLAEGERGAAGGGWAGGRVATLLEEGELAYALVPFLSPAELCAPVAAARPWRRSAAACLAAAGGARPWLAVGGDYIEALQADAFRLCRRGAECDCFDQRHFALAFLVLAAPGDELLSQALALLDGMPAFVPLPASDLRCRQSPADGVDGWVWEADEEGGGSGGAAGSAAGAAGAGAAAAADADAEMARLLRREWASAYIDAEGGYDEEMQSLCLDVIGRWRALWAAARCGGRGGVPGAMRTSASSAVFRHPSLRGTEWWQIKMLSLSSGEPAGQTIAAVIFTYWEKRQMG